MSFNLRPRTRFNYYEPEEPNFDEYIYCEQCSDFVYDYCYIHGPLLVIPDDKVPVKTRFPSYVPRAALTIPHVFLHLAPSSIPDAGLGVFTTLTLPRGVRFGPYRGQRTQDADSTYCWQIFSGNNKRSYVVDAADCHNSNWMRYVNCSRHWKEQNLLAYQFKGQLYYRTIKIVPPYTELMVFYGSEFANALHINLSKYNSANYYSEIIRTSTKTQYDNKDMQEDFPFVNENISMAENNEISCEISNKSKICSAKNVDSYSKESTCSENTMRRKNNPLKTRHKCETCSKTFARTHNLKLHVLKHLDFWKYNCEYCPFKSNRNYNFQRHVGKHTNSFKYSCETCPFKTNYRRSFESHCIRHKSDEELKKHDSYVPAAITCELCDYKTNNRKSYKGHMSKHNGIVFKCDNCSYSSHLKYSLSKHLRRMH